MPQSNAIRRLRRFGGASILALSIFTAGAMLAPSMSAGAQQVQPPYAFQAPNGAPMSFADLIERVSPAVVSINARVQAPSMAPGQTPPGFEGLPPQFREWLEREFGGPGAPQPREGRSLGSGFFISADGHIVTNNHVIENATEITVALSDEREFPARIIGRDPLTDLAVLKVDSDTAFPFVRLDPNPRIRVGDWVVAVGNPFGLGGTATAGIVSATGRELRRVSSQNPFIQIDAPINRGNSGGPAFDLNGNVIGVNSAIFSPSGGNVGIGFAIPSEVAAPIVAQIIERGRVSRGWLGVTIQDIDEDIAESLGLSNRRGALVSAVVNDSPAASGGLQRGDVVLRMNDREVSDSTDLTRRIGATPQGEQVQFRVLRDGRERTLRVTLGERPDEEALTALTTGQPEAAPPPGEARFFGMSLTTLDEPAARRAGLQPGATGLLISAVDADSEAARKGLRPGQVIVEAGGRAVTTAEAFRQAVEQARRDGRSAILVLVQQGGGQAYVALQLDQG
ncbi:MAG: Do family serine endopeptidase [Maricaulaceae bacterium]|nr:Do family serine endopeptidase [Maricaulaceae bacterium]